TRAYNSRRRPVPFLDLPGDTVRHLIAVLLLPFCLPTLAAVQDDKEKAEGFKPLFNGKDLTGWKKYAARKDVWTVEEDMIVCKGDGGGWLGTDRDYSDFELRLEYRLQPAGNSGVYIRAPEAGHISRDGMEIQILDDNHPKYAKI